MHFSDDTNQRLFWRWEACKVWPVLRPGDCCLNCWLQSELISALDHDYPTTFTTCGLHALSTQAGVGDGGDQARYANSQKRLQGFTDLGTVQGGTTGACLVAYINKYLSIGRLFLLLGMRWTAPVSVEEREVSSWKPWWRCVYYYLPVNLWAHTPPFQMRETRTAKGGPDCPTLLHYLARVLLRTNPDLVNFIDEMRTVEAAARSAS